LHEQREADQALELGTNFFDIAIVYPNERSEEIAG
jgi:aryl-alcohol dehydrogenase-like predicted oxidoreductase